MGIIIYFVIGVALLTYSSVRQYQKGRDEFVETSLKHFGWWLTTIAMVALWPVLVVWVIFDLVRMIRNGE